MMWLFAIVGVVIMGGIAVVASGRGGSMPPAYDDRPDLALPPGPIGPEDLRRVRFGIALRGYRMDEVDAVLARLASQLEERHDQSPDAPPETSADTPVESGARSDVSDD